MATQSLAALSSRSGLVAATTGSAGFLSGIVLNAITQQHGLLETVPWDDPVVLRMGLLVAWLAVAAVVSRLLVKRPEGPRVTAWLSLVSLVVLAVSMTWGLVGTTRHGAPPPPAVPQEDKP